ncbi:MAG: bifunctional pyr operon transcriptional regulator/uracil phosphoribosyltransferase PyrR [Verrucomicrobia bacterium]|nr:bifunctional pyr operon transcriptional regulator/uracil phosphoribosyltransferase PyrR [Verrucomicrobiota bacterium]
MTDSPAHKTDLLMDDAAVQAAIREVARQIAVGNPPSGEVLLVGIQTGGVLLARRLAELLQRQWRMTVRVGELDISMHRDDLDQRPAPEVHATVIPFDITERTVVLVDDVLNSGRTARAALDALTDLGRPRRVQLAILVDRGLRELPIQPDFVGKVVKTQPGERVVVQMSSDGAAGKVLLEKPVGR